MRASLWVGLFALVGIGGGVWWWQSRAADDVVTWRLDAVSRGTSPPRSRPRAP
jgi:hypothetical protein